MTDKHEAWAKLQDDLHSAITEVFRKFATTLEDTDVDTSTFGGMLQGYLLLTEWNGIDGERRVDMTASEDARLWDIQGWLGHVKSDLDAQYLQNTILDTLQNEGLI